MNTPAHLHSRFARALALAAGVALALSFTAGARQNQPERIEPPRLRPAGDYQNSISRSELRERALDALSRLATTSEFPQVRANAVEALGQVPTRAEPVIRDALDDGNLGVRFAACFTAGRAKLKKLAPDVRPLLTDYSQDVRAAAIFALHRMGADVDPTPLSAMLESRDMRLRANAAMILGEMGDASAAPMLRAAAKNDRFPGSRAQRRLISLQIAEALFKLGDREQIHTVRAALYPVGPEDLEASVLAAQIIGNVADRESAAELKNRAIDTIRPEDIAAAAQAGEPVRPGVAGEFLMPPELRLAAVTSLGKMGFREGGFIVDAFALTTDPLLRSQAAFAYGETGGVVDLPKLEFLLGDQSELVRVAAAGSVVKIVDRLASGG